MFIYPKEYDVIVVGAGHAGVEAVHIYSNVVTVDLAPGASTEGMAEALGELFIHYRKGVTPSLP